MRWTLPVAMAISLAIDASAVASPAGDDAACTSTALPGGHLFAPLAADPYLSRLGVGFGLLSSDRALLTSGTNRIAVGIVALGGTVGLYRHSDRDCNGLQIGLGGSVLSLFRMHSTFTRLLSVDYRGSLPLELRHGMVSARLRLSHQSDHLGDGFALDGAGVRGEVASHEWADLTIAAGGDFGRIYLGGGTILHAELPVTREVLFGGFEIGSAAPGFSPLLAVHWQTFGTKDFSGTLNVQAGLSFIAERRLDLVFVLTHGDNPYSQFFNRESIDLIAVELRAGL